MSRWGVTVAFPPANPYYVLNVFRKLEVSRLIPVKRSNSSNVGFSPVATGGFWWAKTPRQCSKPPNWNMKHYKSAKVCQCLQCQAPCTKVKPPVENFLVTVLAHTQGCHTKKCNGKLVMHQNVSQIKKGEIVQFWNLAQKIN